MTGRPGLDDLGPDLSYQIHTSFCVVPRFKPTRFTHPGGDNGVKRCALTFILVMAGLVARKSDVSDFRH
ncbi:hypothetical protein [Bradyrhizobium sp. WD16]|uniref:hypothetical protein n=1 Tax=Bradyrhizobium sp. WD16 TaxID=1521768 RepID=UPI0020A30246|nr:hypothetical protein [Bradyrhizobium sp. WD16]